jgi:hypothetical protein
LCPEELEHDHAGYDDETCHEVGLETDRKGDEEDDKDRRHRPEGYDYTPSHRSTVSFKVCYALDITHMIRTYEGLSAFI